MTCVWSLEIYSDLFNAVIGCKQNVNGIYNFGVVTVIVYSVLCPFLPRQVSYPPVPDSARYCITHEVTRSLVTIFGACTEYSPFNPMESFTPTQKFLTSSLVVFDKQLGGFE